MSSDEIHRSKSGRRRKGDRTRSKRSRRRSYSSSSSDRGHGKSRGLKVPSGGEGPRMSLATYKAHQPAITQEDLKMNEFCRELGLNGGEYRDGFYVRYIENPDHGLSREPRVRYEEKVKYIDVPEIEYVTREVPEITYEDVVKEVPRIERVEVPKEVIKHVPKIKTKTRTVEVPVPGKKIDNPIHYDVPRMVINPTYHDQEQEVVVAQVLKPNIHVNKGRAMKVEAYAIDPVLYPVDVFIPFPVQAAIKAVHVGETHHYPVDIPDAHYNALVNRMNETVPDDYRADLFKTRKGKKGKKYIPMLSPEEAVQVTQSLHNVHHGAINW